MNNSSSKVARNLASDWLTADYPLPALEGGTCLHWRDALAAGHAPPPHVVGAGDMALLPYTSGTTGLDDYDFPEDDEDEVK